MCECAKGLSPSDPYSFSRPERVAVTQARLDLEVNFDNKTLEGFVDLTIYKKDPSTSQAILDTLGLSISEVTEVNLDVNLNYVLHDSYKRFGSKLVIDLPTHALNEFVVRIKYKTSPDAPGLHWLTSDQTEKQKTPFLFTEFQTIGCRSAIPLQDTPSAKVVYSANLTIPSNLTGVMSAICTNKEQDGLEKTKFVFNQPIPIAPYLIAMAIGQLECKTISPRINVWSEPELADACADELANVERYLSTAESICGPYLWERCDFLVLPPSFTFGGMENPNMIFIKSSSISGDHSAKYLLLNEISHCWAGNLVTMTNLQHIWLSEGFAVYLERKIIGVLEGHFAEDFRFICGLKTLEEHLEDIGKDDPSSAMIPNLKKLDDYTAETPAMKGAIFLKYLEQIVGGPYLFDPFLRCYFDTYKRQSISSNDFKAFFENYFQSCDAIQKINWDMWYYSTGMPDVLPQFNKTYEEICCGVMRKIRGNIAGLKETEAQELDVSQKEYIFKTLADGEPLPPEKVAELEKLFDVINLKNPYVTLYYYRICINAEMEEKIDEALNFINTTPIGKSLGVRSLYKDLYNFEKAQQKTIETFKKNRVFMNNAAALAIESDLQLGPPESVP